MTKEQLKEIRERRAKITTKCLCGLHGCKNCEWQSDFEVNALTDIDDLLKYVGELEKWHQNIEVDVNLNEKQESRIAAQEETLKLCRAYGKDMKELHRQVLMRSEEKEGRIEKLRGALKFYSSIEHPEFPNITHFAKEALEADK